MHTFPDSVDAFRHKILLNRMKNDCFMATGTCKMDHLLSINVLFIENIGIISKIIGRLSKFLCVHISTESEYII